MRWLLLLFPALVSADLVVSEGHLVISGGMVRETFATGVQNATMTIEDGSAVTTGDMHIHSQGTVRGCGTLITSGTITNEGLILIDCGAGFALNLAGDVHNATGGVIRAGNGTAVVFGSSIFNYGILDLIFSPSVPPGNIDGDGAVLVVATLPGMSFGSGAENLSFRIYNGHAYQVQYADDLTTDPVVWNNSGTTISTSSDFEDVTVSVDISSSVFRVYRYRLQ